MRWKDIVKYHGNKYVLFGIESYFVAGRYRVESKLYKIVDEKPKDLSFFYYCKIKDVVDKDLRKQVKEYIEHKIF